MATIRHYLLGILFFRVSGFAAESNVISAVISPSDPVNETTPTPPTISRRDGLLFVATPPKSNRRSYPSHIFHQPVIFPYSKPYLPRPRYRPKTFNHHHPPVTIIDEVTPLKKLIQSQYQMTLANLRSLIPVENKIIIHHAPKPTSPVKYRKWPKYSKSKKHGKPKKTYNFAVDPYDAFYYDPTESKQKSSKSSKGSPKIIQFSPEEYNAAILEAFSPAWPEFSETPTNLALESSNISLLHHPMLDDARDDSPEFDYQTEESRNAYPKWYQSAPTDSTFNLPKKQQSLPAVSPLSAPSTFVKSVDDYANPIYQNLEKVTNSRGDISRNLLYVARTNSYLTTAKPATIPRKPVVQLQVNPVEPIIIASNLKTMWTQKPKHPRTTTTPTTPTTARRTTPKPKSYITTTSAPLNKNINNKIKQMIPLRRSEQTKIHLSNLKWKAQRLPKASSSTEPIVSSSFHVSKQESNRLTPENYRRPEVMGTVLPTQVSSPVGWPVTSRKSELSRVLTTSKPDFAITVGSQIHVNERPANEPSKWKKIESRREEIFYPRRGIVIDEPVGMKAELTPKKLNFKQQQNYKKSNQKKTTDKIFTNNRKRKEELDDDEHFQFDLNKPANSMRRLAFSEHFNEMPVKSVIGDDDSKLRQVFQELNKYQLGKDPVKVVIVKRTKNVKKESRLFEMAPELEAEESAESIESLPEKKHKKRGSPVKRKPSCKGRDTGYYADISNDCKGYFYCDQYGSVMTFKCPSSTRFSQETSVCEWPDQVKCKEE